MATTEDRHLTDLEKLAVPFPASLIKKAPQGKYGSYVKHSAVTERLLSIVGPYDYEIVQVIHGHAPAVIGKGEQYTKDNPHWPAREHAVVGCVARLTCEIDGVKVSVEEAGDVEDPAMENDGRNLKDASSDAIKRCAMRFGLGLHLWSQDDYFLDRQLKHDAVLPAGAEGAESIADEAVDPEAEAVREKYRQRHAEVAERVAEETKPYLEAALEDELAAEEPNADGQIQLTPEHAAIVEMAAALRTEGTVTTNSGSAATIEQAREKAEVVPISAANRGKARSALEWEVGLLTEGRMKCKGACEHLDPYQYEQPCCVNAHLRRLYQLAEAGLELDHEPMFKDLLHQALAKSGAAHVGELNKNKLDGLADASKIAFTKMLYGPPT